MPSGRHHGSLTIPEADLPREPRVGFPEPHRAPEDGSAAGGDRPGGVSPAVAAEDAPRWIELRDGRAFSRLLYPNPVCFLTAHSLRRHGPAPESRSVMVLSWLTATNNRGRFAFSLNRGRSTASALLGPDGGGDGTAGGAEFALSVPVGGMERLVLDVGGTSGRWGDKFRSDGDGRREGGKGGTAAATTAPSAGVGAEAPAPGEPLSNRQKREARRRRLSGGVPGLTAVPLGNVPRVAAAPDPSGGDATGGGGPGPGEAEGSPPEPFAVGGTVAHMRCRAYRVVDDPPDAVDSDHSLVLAEVLEAYVHPSYWDAERGRFRPGEGAPPYLTFLGSQSFGYVVCGREDGD